jgi:hypothetical protein
MSHKVLFLSVTILSFAASLLAQEPVLPAPAFPAAATPREFALAAMKLKATQQYGAWKVTTKLKGSRVLVSHRYLSKDEAGFQRYRSDTEIFDGEIRTRSSSSIENEAGRWILFPHIGAALRDPHRSPREQAFAWDSPLMDAYDFSLGRKPSKSPANDHFYYEVLMELDEKKAEALRGDANLNNYPRLMKILIDPSGGAIMGYSLHNKIGGTVSAEYYDWVSLERPPSEKFEIPYDTSFYFAKTEIEYKSVLIYYEVQERRIRDWRSQDRETKRQP